MKNVVSEKFQKVAISGFTPARVHVKVGSLVDWTQFDQQSKHPRIMSLFYQLLF